MYILHTEIYMWKLVFMSELQFCFFPDSAKLLNLIIFKLLLIVTLLWGILTLKKHKLMTMVSMKQP